MDDEDGDIFETPDIAEARRLARQYEKKLNATAQNSTDVVKTRYRLEVVDY